MRRVEITMFSCLQWGTLVTNIEVDSYGTVCPAFSPCDSLIKMCIPVNYRSATMSSLQLDFNHYSDHSVYLAEVAFYNESLPCLPFSTIPRNWTLPS